MFAISRADLIRQIRWPEHDPGDEDEPSWIGAPVAPSRSLVAVRDREILKRARIAADVVPFWFAGSR